MISKLAMGILAALSIGCLAASALADEGMDRNPYAPAYGHPYRHGAVPTREAHARMKAWDAAHTAKSRHGGSNILAYGGGLNGIGVTSGTPKVYLVFWGSQWSGSGDPNRAAAYLTELFTGMGSDVKRGSGWSGTMTQYCDGGSLTAGATTCQNVSGVAHIGVPNGALAGTWYDTAAAAPSSATLAQLAAEAVAAAAYFGNTTQASNRYAQYVIVSPSGTHPDGFGTRHSNFCAWHDYTTATTISGTVEIAYTNMPYVTDLGASCGENFVNAGAAGALDGFSIVNGHEYAETLTDQLPAGGWTNPTNGAENGDECAWISAGVGASADVSMSTGSFAMQSTWSNDTNACAISHAVVP